MVIPNVSERRRLPPQVGVSVVILALSNPNRSDAAPSCEPHCSDSYPEPAPHPASHPEPGAEKTLWIPLVRRIRRPYLGQWALPGSELIQGLSLEEVAQKALVSTTHLNLRYLEQLYTFGDPDRSSGGLPMVSIVYWSLVGVVEDLSAARNVQWFPVSHLPDMAFDHRKIVDYAVERLRAKIGSPRIMTRFLGSTFTLRQLHAVCEAVSGQSIDLANFRRKVLTSGTLEKTGGTAQVGSKRPAALYRYKGTPRDDARPGDASP